MQHISIIFESLINQSKNKSKMKKNVKNLKFSAIELQILYSAIDMYKKELEASEFPER